MLRNFQFNFWSSLVRDLSIEIGRLTVRSPGIQRNTFHYYTINRI